MILPVSEFDVKKYVGTMQIKKRKRGTRNKGGVRRYYSDVCAFDIETTRLVDIEQAFMYLWQFQIDDKFSIYGRTWDEFFDMIHRLVDNLPQNNYLVVYVHNLSYEFQFLSGIYKFRPDEVFCVKSRKILKCEMFGHLEFRCSYLHSNMSLDEYTHKMGVPMAKRKDFDYDKIRYPWTSLDADELDYGIRDVAGLVQAIKKEMAIDGDDLYTIPLTSTGYVRRMAKEAMRDYATFDLPKILPNYHVYKMLREAFSGGDTHANRYYCDTIIDDVKSVDRSSSYPDVQINKEFPMGKFYEAGEITQDELLDLMNRRHKAVLARIALYGVEIRDEIYGSPSIMKSHCRNLRGGTYDNGRVLSADYLEITLTDVDIRTLLRIYTWDDMVILDCAYARYGQLPKQLKNVIIELYRRKTALKNVPGQEIYYMKSKNMLNSVYGMTVQDPVKQDILYESGEYNEQSENEEKLLAENDKRAFLSYAWGVWTTAWARSELHELIEITKENHVYNDTDSVKYFGNFDFTDYNERHIKASRKSGAYAHDKNGKIYYMGVADDDGYYKQFKTLGAKKYAYTDNDSKTHVTIAGVNKAKGGAELDKYNGLNSFKEGFCFNEAGGTESVYNDSDYGWYHVDDGLDIYISKNVVIKPSTYTLGITEEYRRLLDNLPII